LVARRRRTVTRIIRTTARVREAHGVIVTDVFEDFRRHRLRSFDLVTSKREIREGAIDVLSVRDVLRGRICRRKRDWLITLHEVEGGSPCKSLLVVDLATERDGARYPWATRLHLDRCRHHVVAGIALDDDVVRRPSRRRLERRIGREREQDVGICWNLRE